MKKAHYRATAHNEWEKDERLYQLVFELYPDFFRIFDKIVQIFVHLKKLYYKATALSEWGRNERLCQLIFEICPRALVLIDS